MNKKKVINLAKRIVAGCLTLSVIAAGIVVTPKTVKAEEKIVKDEIIYSPMDMAKYWKEDAKTAPVLEGYVFAGWYTADNSENVTAIKEADVIPENTTTYAKFVPAYVLSVKTQVLREAEVSSTEMANKGDDFSTFMRVLSSVDSGDYKNVGFEIILGNAGTTTLNVNPITKVYAGLKLSATDADDKIIRPESVFGEAADHFIALDLEKINIKSFSSKIYIRPYWTTLDGTKVEGLAKNVRVEDKYSDYRYISVPVNLLTDGAKPTEVAAGMVEITYNATKFEVATDAAKKERIDTGRLLPEMEYVVDSVNGKIKFVGNMANYSDGDVKADGLYANIRFIRKQGYDNAKESDLALKKEVIKFCDWAEDEKAVKAW